MPHHEITIAKDGTITVEGIDFKGSSCQLPKALLEALGQTVESRKKPEFYQAVTTTIAQKTGGK